MSSRTYYVYILANATRTLYVGVTNNLERRVAQHRSQTTPGFTSRYNISMLVHVDTYPDPAQAIAREKQHKGWLRANKIALMETENPDWLDLSAGWFG